MWGPQWGTLGLHRCSAGHRLGVGAQDAGSLLTAQMAHGTWTGPHFQLRALPGAGVTSGSAGGTSEGWPLGMWSSLPQGRVLGALPCMFPKPKTELGHTTGERQTKTVFLLLG